MSDVRTDVRINPANPEKVEVIIKGASCSTFNLLTRTEARVLAAQIGILLHETEE